MRGALLQTHPSLLPEHKLARSQSQRLGWKAPWFVSRHLGPGTGSAMDLLCDLWQVLALSGLGSSLLE